MGDDPTFQWTLASRYGIQVDETQDAWHSGHVNDILELDSGGLLVATQTGGVWSIDTNGDTLPLSDSWEDPDVNCLAFGPDGPQHVFAGCTRGIIRETDLGEALPLLAWKQVANPLPVGAGAVHRIVVIRSVRRIVAACDGGVFWSEIPSSNGNRGCLAVFLPGSATRQPFCWKPAKVDGAPSTGFWDLAVGATRSDQLRVDLQDPRVITIVAGGFISGGVFAGQWNGADLVLKRARIVNDDGTDATGLFALVGTTSVSSCEVRPNVLYAGCSGQSGALFRVFRSQDGGFSWAICGWVSVSPEDNLVSLAGGQGLLWNNCISVAPTNPDLVALGWVELFLTLDGGKTWRQVQEDTHLHPDRHALLFTPSAPSDHHNLYVGSDGGVVRINMDDYLGLTGQPFQSNYNRLLPALQCYSTPELFYGTIAASKVQPGLIAAGLQDNGNVHCAVGPATTPWVDIDGGDGGWNAFLADGVMLHNTANGPVGATVVDLVGVVTVTATIPVANPALPTGLDEPVGDAVAQPTYTDGDGHLLEAVAGLNNQVFGLFREDLGSLKFHWDLVGTVPSGETVKAVWSFAGDKIFAGTASGRIFAVDPKTLGVVEQELVSPKPSPTSTIIFGSVNRIVGFGENDVFATMKNVVAKSVDFTTGAVTIVKLFFVLRLSGGRWAPTASIGLPNQEYFGLEAVSAPRVQMPRALVASTDDRVWVSRDDGATWQQASLGLPRNPHCRDLRFTTVQGRSTLYLGTWGRSVWQAPLG